MSMPEAPIASSSFPRLPRSFYQRDAVTVARALLGQRLVRLLDGQRLAGLIVETEAYLGVEDAAAHTVGGRRTARNESMWGDGGHAYVYFTYGMHHCINAVAGTAGQPVAVLIRALEPVEGLEIMWQRRPKARHDRQLCAGPGRLTAALGIERELDGADLVRGEQLFIERARLRCVAGKRIIAGPRIGVDYAGEWTHKPLRFCLRDNSFVSR